MSAGETITSFRRDTDKLSVRIVTDPADRVYSPALPKARIAMHMGRSVFMVCQRAGLKHNGWGIHGDIDVVPAGIPCVWEPREPDTALIVGLTPELLASAAEDLNLHADRLELVNRFQIRDAQIERICWALKEEMEANYPTGRFFLDSLASALAAELVQRHSSLATRSLHCHRSLSGHKLRRALSYIEDHLNADLSLDEIARSVGLSVSHLRATFRQTTGTSVHRFIVQRRLERAKTLLVRTKLSISDIAQQAGFSHPSHLANHMRRMWGCTPKAFRTASR